MSDSMWGEPNENEEEFRDMPEESQTGVDGQPVVPVQETYSPPSRAPIARQMPSINHEPVQDDGPYEAEPGNEEEYGDVVRSLGIGGDEDMDLFEAMNDAHLRLEQGNLWRIIINHDLFAGSDADPKAIQNVQLEIRKFAKERMEIMLGMRKETTQVEHLEIDFPFNALEVDVLKKLAFTATKGATQHSDNFVPEVKRVKEEIPNVPRKTTLNTIGTTKKVPTKPVEARRGPDNGRPLQKRPTAPIKRTKLDADIDRICREEGVPRELLEENLKPLTKPVHELTDQQLLERNRLAAERRGTQVPSSTALSMPTPEQMEAMAYTHANTLAAGRGMSRILDAVKKMPIKNP